MIKITFWTYLRFLPLHSGSVMNRLKKESFTLRGQTWHLYTMVKVEQNFCKGSIFTRKTFNVGSHCRLSTLAPSMLGHDTTGSPP